MTDTMLLSRRTGLMIGKYYNLGQVGGRIWELLEKPMTVAALVQKLTAEYDVSAERCRADLGPFLNKLLEQGLLVEG